MTQRERQILQWIEQDPMISQEALAEKAGITRSSVAVHISNLMKKGYIAGKGYVLRSGTYAVVVGGVNIDIGGRSYGPLVARDSNPGRVQMSLGGVGRNIAHNMALLGLEVHLLTAFGDDLYAQRIAASCGELGIDISRALQVSRRRHLHLSLHQRSRWGHGPGRVSDMDICRQMHAAVSLKRQPVCSEPCPADCGRCQSPGGVHPLSGGELYPPPVLCRPGLHRPRRRS
ncbi:MAG: PfkB family carbohydrate kinase [Oscillospiraceae bacterium]